MLITPGHLAMQRRLFRESSKRGISGQRWAGYVRRLVARIEADSVLDYGAGAGTLAKVLDGEIAVEQYDPVTFPCEPEPADIVVCTDVLEQVERICLDDVLEHIKALARKAVFIVVAIHPESAARRGLIIEEPDWWLAQLAERWPDHESKVSGAVSRRLKFEAMA